MANWELIKQEYCSGIPPRELAVKHKIKANTISIEATKGGWVEEKQIKTKEIAKDFEEERKRITTLALKRLAELLAKETIKDTDLVSAIGKSLDISGLKSQKVDGDIAFKQSLIKFVD